MPALAERANDIAELASHLLRLACTRIGREVTGFDSAAAAAMRRYGWPGNVRELENAIRSAVLMANGSRIGLLDLPPEIRDGDRQCQSDALKRRVEETERLSIEDALRRTGNCRTDAAAALGITRITLYNKMKKLGIS
jgi:DNA-binding NtrC family response regulator